MNKAELLAALEAAGVRLGYSMDDSKADLEEALALYGDHGSPSVTIDDENIGWTAGTVWEHLKPDGWTGHDHAYACWCGRRRGHPLDIGT